MPTPPADQPHVVWHETTVSRADRERLAGHRGAVVWFTGLSGSGKSTVANAVDARLHAAGVRTFVLDGDNVRHGLNATPQILGPVYGDTFAERFGLGFGPEDRAENVRRVGAVARLLCEAGIVTLTAFVSPYREDRDRVRSQLEDGDFVEVFVDTPLEICEQRDPKGLYKKARAAEIRGFTGIDAPYEPPASAELVLPGERPVDELVDAVFERLRAAEIVPR